jgi:hypothetical protein
MIFLGDAGMNASNFLVSTYGDALKSDMVQVSHHGCENATAELYDMIAAHTAFWPCSEGLMATYRGEKVKQHILSAEYTVENLLHGYGDITRPLSYKSSIELFSIMPRSASVVSTSSHAGNVRYEDGVLKFDVTGTGEKLDPYITYTLKNVSTEKYNAIRIVVDSNATKSSSIYFTTGGDPVGKFVAEKAQGFGVMGEGIDGKTVLVGYLADVDGYTGKFSSIRLDFGHEYGQTIEIYSIDLFYIDVD